MTASPLTRTPVLANGCGRYFLRCHACHRTSPTWVRADLLKLLALAQGAGWRVGEREGKYEVTCSGCVSREERANAGD